MMFLSKDQFNTLVEKLNAIATALDKIHSVYAAEPKPTTPKLVVHNNGKRKWGKRTGGELTATDAVMDIMSDGIPRHRNRICKDVNQAGKCRIKVRPKTIGYAFTDLCAKGKLQRVGDGVYARAS